MKKVLSIVIVMIISIVQVVQGGTTGKLVGKVTDKKTGEPLPLVNIILEGTTIGGATDIDGNYIILNIPPGKYTVKYQFVGYQTVIVNDVKISIDLTTVQNVEMEESAVTLGDIVVSADVYGIQKDITSSQAKVTSEEISNLPVTELNDVLQLQAGVTKGAGGEFHIRGGRSSEIAYWVNGISVTDAFDNSRGIEIDNSSVQELQVISGTFNAEYGQALSGIINVVTKEGSSKYDANVKVYTSDYLSNFTKYFTGIDKFNPVANYNFQGSLSGPIPFTNNKLTFFSNARYVYDDGYLYGIRKFNPDGTTGDGELVPMNWNKRFLGQLNLSLWATSAIKMNAELLYSTEDFRDYNHFFKLNPDGDVNKFSDSYNATFTLTHTLSSRTYYTVKVSNFFKEFNEWLYEDPLDSRYLHPDSLITVSYAFASKGTNLHRFFRSTNSLIGKFDFTSQITDKHLVKFGVEGRWHKIDVDDYNLEPLRVNGVPVEPFVPSIPAENTPNRTKYSNTPYEFSAYIQDKIEYESVIINIGVRLDYFNSNAKVLVDPTDPNIYLPLREELAALSIEEREPYFYKNATPKWAIGPRFGIAYPISDKGVLHFSYGQFLQVPTFQYLYNRGPYYVPNTGSAYGPYGNPDLKPQSTVMYEIGLRQQFFEDYTVDVTTFYRDIRNWITAGPLIITRNLVSYSTYINKDYSNVKGITLNLNKRFSNHYAIDLNYTYQVAEGSNSNPEDEFYAQLGNNEPTLYLIPLDWDQRHLVNLSFFVGDNDWGASLIARYGTGLPYTPSITQYIADRGITSGLQRNSRRRPTQHVFDLRLHKTFDIAGISLTSFLNVFNLFDTRVVVNVFGDTGKPDYTTEGRNVGDDPKRPNSVEEYLRYPTNYGEPRLIQFGLELSF
ncbi:TonB-dependent receptor [Melioribacter sp. OK-6-Me]|uniref:TonB-dependent receptor n=1 Tax=unclassified Melioribacter TaxID=2627329 RepID=UPI003EDB68A4